jgi:hypothetical protein
VRIRTRAVTLCASLAAGLLAAPGHAAFPGGDGLLVFDSDRTGAFDVYTTSLDGTGLVNLTNSPGLVDVNPVWDPGGDLIVHASGPTGGPFDIRVMNADGSGGAPPAPHPANDVQPTFCDPDTVVFASDRDGDFDLWEVGVDGTGLNQIANLPGNQVQASCRPDGQRIAYASNQDGNFEVYEIDRDGTDPVRLTDHPAFDFWPDYQPDGRSLLIASTRDGNSDIYRLDLAAGRGIGLPAIEQLTFETPPVQLFDVAVYPTGLSAAATRSDGQFNSVVRFSLSPAAGGPAALVSTPANNSGASIRPTVRCVTSAVVGRPESAAGDIGDTMSVVTIDGSEGADLLLLIARGAPARAVVRDADDFVCELLLSNTERITIDTGSGDDDVTIDADLLSRPGLVGVPMNAFLGAGDDGAAVEEVLLRGGPGTGAGSPYGLRGAGRTVDFRGGPGNDLLVGGVLGDYLVGGPGLDTVRGGRGNDTFRARDGERDVIVGGPGRDSGRFDPVDQVSGVERRT